MVEKVSDTVLNGEGTCQCIQEGQYGPAAQHQGLLRQLGLAAEEAQPKF